MSAFTQNHGAKFTPAGAQSSQSWHAFLDRQPSHCRHAVATRKLNLGNSPAAGSIPSRVIIS
jgi:hypothetical protein